MSAGFPGAGTLVRFPSQPSIRQSPSRLLRPSIGRGTPPRFQGRKAERGSPRFHLVSPPYAVLRVVSRYSAQFAGALLLSHVELTSAPTGRRRRRCLSGRGSGVVFSDSRTAASHSGPVPGAASLCPEL